MKKFVTLFLALALVLAMGAVSLAYDNYTDDWKVTAVREDDGSVTIAADGEAIKASTGWASVAWLYVAIYDEDQNYTSSSFMSADEEGADVQETHPFSDAVAGPGNAGAVAGAALTYNIKAGTEGTATYNFEEGKTYYIYICACDTANWAWNTEATEFTYGDAAETPETPDKDDSQGTGDFSAIAYAAAALAGCGALVIRKKK